MGVQTADVDIGEAAEEFATQVNQAVADLEGEEELRIEMESIIRDILEELGEDISPENERTVISGRPDAVYGDLIIEYKDPDIEGDWIKEAMYGRDESDHGLVDYMREKATDEGRSEEEIEAILSNMIGVGTNGREIFFCRYRPGKEVAVREAGQTSLQEELLEGQVRENVEVVDTYRISEGARAFLTYARSLTRRPLTSEELARSFGPEGEVARETITKFYKELQDALENEHPRVTTLYNEWERVFGIVYGDELSDIEDDKQIFGELYDFDEPEVKKLLFSVHTYYALLMKILVNELLAVVRDNPIEESGLAEPDDERLKEKLHKIENGEQYDLAGIKDFFEEGFFGWYLDVADEETLNKIRLMAEKMETFEPATASIKPEAVRDILKDLYQELVPRAIRHDLGEYLTPDWLAEFTISETGYEGEGRVLDPACGSGTFLIESIKILRENSEKEGEELLQHILENVVGFDLNPVSVISARTNYLMALGELAFHSSELRIPVYQSDSILTPSEHVDVRAFGKKGSGGTSYSVETDEGEFRVPALGSRQKIGDFLEKVQQMIEVQGSTDEFLELLEKEMDLDENLEDVSKSLYGKISKLEEEGRDGVWTDLLRNRMAPEFTGEFDYVMGNPPWINWQSISEDYRGKTKDLWQNYNLFSLSGSAGRLGGGKKDISMLFTYVSADNYLAEGGKLGFLIPEPNFKSEKTGDGFRNFNQGKFSLRCEKVHDLSDFNPFDAANRTSLMVAEKGEETKYPVDYFVWEKNERGSISFSYSLEEVMDRVMIHEMEASPITDDNKTSPWLSTRKGFSTEVRKALGESDYDAHLGSNTGGANGVYWIDILQEGASDKLKVQNLPNAGRKDIPQKKGLVEKELVYPLLQGRDVEAFDAEPNGYLILPQNPEDKDALDISEMRIDFPKTLEFLSEFEEDLESRALHKQYHNPDKDPFYRMHNVGVYTLSQYKAVWREVSNEMICAVSEPVEDKYLGKKPVVPAHTCVLVATSSEEEAHYITALMNSFFAREVVRGYGGLHPSPHVLDNIKVPRFDSNDSIHVELAKLSKKAHKEGISKDILLDIDKKAAELWDIEDSILSNSQYREKRMNFLE